MVSPLLRFYAWSNLKIIIIIKIHLRGTGTKLSIRYVREDYQFPLVLDSHPSQHVLQRIFCNAHKGSLGGGGGEGGEDNSRA